MKKEEYLMLRQEILQILNNIQTMRQVMYIVVGGLLTYAFSKDDPLFALLPYIIIIPFFTISLVLDDSMFRIVGYMVVFLEGNEFNWESRMLKLGEVRTERKEGFYKYIRSKCNSILYSPYVLLSVFCFIVFLYKMVSFYDVLDLDFILRIISGTIIFSILYFLSKLPNKMPRRRDYIRMWEKIKIEEDSKKK